MNRKIALLSAALILPFLAGCSSSLSRKEMTQGEKLFRSYCRTCHRLPDPKKHSDDAWVTLVKRYGASTKLNDVEKDEIIKYLQQANKD